MLLNYWYYMFMAFSLFMDTLYSSEFMKIHKFMISSIAFHSMMPINYIFIHYNNFIFIMFSLLSLWYY